MRVLDPSPATWPSAREGELRPTGPSYRRNQLSQNSLPRPMAA